MLNINQNGDELEPIIPIYLIEQHMEEHGNEWNEEFHNEIVDMMVPELEETGEFEDFNVRSGIHCFVNRLFRTYLPEDLLEMSEEINQVATDQLQTCLMENMKNPEGGNGDGGNGDEDDEKDNRKWWMWVLFVLFILLLLGVVYKQMNN